MGAKGELYALPSCRGRLERAGSWGESVAHAYRQTIQIRAGRHAGAGGSAYFQFFGGKLGLLPSLCWKQPAESFMSHANARSSGYGAAC